MEISLRTDSPLERVPDDYHPPGSGRLFTIGDGADAGRRMFYFDHCTADAPAATIVFVHGNPECSYTYRHVRDALIACGRPLRLIAMDHIGFGLSDQARFEMVDMHHAANLGQLVRHLDLRDVTLVVHDWGGPIGIGAFVDAPERVRNLLVLNSTVFPMPADGYTYRNYPYPWLPWCHTPQLIPDALWGGLAAYVVSHAEPQPAARFVVNAARQLLRHARGRIPETAPESVWSGQMRSRANVRSSKRNVRQTPHWGHGYRYHDARMGEQDNRAFYRRMQQVVPQAWGAAGRNIAVGGHFGAWDPCGKASVIRQWHEALPRMAQDTHVYADVGHFVEEYKGAQIARSILALNEMGP